MSVLSQTKNHPTGWFLCVFGKNQPSGGVLPALPQVQLCPQLAQLLLQPEQLPPQLQLPLERIIFRRAKAAASRITPSSTQSRIPMAAPSQPQPSARPSSRSSRAASHAMPHCQSTTPTAQPRPSSRRMEAMAATQGV